MTVYLQINDAAHAHVGLAWDMSVGAFCLDPLDDGTGEEAAVGNDIAGQAQPFNQDREGCLVGGLARRQHQADGQTERVHDRMDLGAQSPTRTADGVIRAPFLPPAAC